MKLLIIALIDPSIDTTAVDGQMKFQVDKCQHASRSVFNRHSYLFVTPCYSPQISLIAYTPTSTHPPQPFIVPPARAGAEWRSVDLGRVVSARGPLTNTQPNVLIDPMPSYFRTSARRQGAARRDRQTAVLKELEQGEEEEAGEWMEGRRGQWWVHSTLPRRSTRRQGAQVQLCKTE